MPKRPWRSIDADLLRFTTTESRDLHIAVMSAFEQAAVLAPALNLDRVRAAVLDAGWDEPIADDALLATLTALAGWGLLEATQDHSARYATPEEFERRNLQWSLTPRGAAAISGVLHALESLHAAVGLQTAVLDAIGDDLSALAELMARPRNVADDARLHVQLSQVERHLESLVTSVRQFNGHLQRLLREDGNDDDIFNDVKRRTISYLEEYVDGVERPQRRLARAIGLVEQRGLATLFDRALAGANLAPVADGDPGPVWIAERERRWQALCAWFAPRDASAPLVAGLITIARTAIVELLRVLERRWDHRRRSASIAHDFRALARVFARAPGDDEAHRIFAAAIGIWPARHAHVLPPDGTTRAVQTSWLQSEPAEVAPALRTTGSLTNRGKMHPVADPALIRARRQREQAAALRAHDRLRQALVTDGTVRLSSFGDLPAAGFAELLTVLAAALDAPRGADGTRRALSVDGAVEVVLREPHDGRTARLRTDAGTLTAPDFHVAISLIGESGERQEAANG